MCLYLLNPRGSQTWFCHCLVTWPLCSPIVSCSHLPGSQILVCCFPHALACTYSSNLVPSLNISFELIYSIYCSYGLFCCLRSTQLPYFVVQHFTFFVDVNSYNQLSFVAIHMPLFERSLHHHAYLPNFNMQHDLSLTRVVVTTFHLSFKI